jgi:hypothetical protein
MTSLSQLPALHVPDGRPAWVHYLDYQAIGRAFDDLTPDTMPDAVALVRRAAGVELPPDFDSVQFNLWALLRRGYWAPNLTDAQQETLARLFSLTNPTDEDDDTPLAPEGSHRALHTFLTRELGERIPETRGAAYAVASAYLRKHQPTA